LGLAPRFTHCCFCQRPLADRAARWLPAEGGFSCAECLGQTLDGQNDLWHRYWQRWAYEKYGDLCQQVAALPPQGEELSNYFFYQTDLRPERCKSWPLLLAAGLGLHCR
ncbi:MAG: hypothetical protein J6Y94_07940, partial [Bacteriovoracaceae bacterium]|nr:hypothetical protein [Bacteriovoracaceae bacterium]